MDAEVLQIMGLDPYELRLPLAVGDAVSRWLKHKHPHHTAKNVARDTGIDPRTVENILDRHLSGPNLTRLAQTYRWQFWRAVGAAVIGETDEAAITRELEEIANERAELDGREQDLRKAWAGHRARRAVGRGGLRLVSETDTDPRRDVGG